MNPTNTDPVYDRDRDQPVTRPDLRELEEGGQPSASSGSASVGSGTGASSGGNFSFNPGGDKSNKDNAGTGTKADSSDGFRFSGDDGSGKTGSTGTTGAASGLLSKELAGAAGVAGAATSLAGTAKNLFWGSKNRKRASVGGGLTATLVGGGILLLTVASGPAELIHLAQLLEHNFSISESDSQSRTSSLLRSYNAYKNDDWRYSRVGLIGKNVMEKVVGQFENAGVQFTGSDVFGVPTGISVDRPAVEEKFPETKGMSDAELNDFLNSKFGVDSNLSFQTAEAGKSYKLDIEGLNSSAIKGYANKTSTEILGDNKVVAAAKLRSLKDFFGLGSLFRPFSTAIQDKIRARVAEIKKNNPKESDGAANEQAATEVEDTEYADNTSTIQEKGVTEGYDKAKAADDSYTQQVGSKLLPVLGGLWAGGCTLNGLSGAIVSMNRDLVVLPSAVEAAQLVSAGSEIENGNSGNSGITAAQVNAIVKGFSNSQGQNIWSAASLRAMQDPTAASKLPRNSNGQIENNIPGEYQQAYGINSTSSTLTDISNIMLSWFPLHYVSGVVPGGQCGLVAGSTIVVAGAFTQFFLAIGNIPDGETGNVALQAAVQAGEDTGVGYAQGKLLSPVINTVIDRIAKATVAPKLTRQAFSGTLGGNLIAYGGRAVSNSSSILNGGLALGNNASTIVGSAGEEQQQQFRSENFFARMFDINDYRSLTGHLADSISPNVGTNLQLGLSNTLSIGGILSSVFGNLIPHTSADTSTASWTGNYDWTFPQYGIPPNMLNDPAFADPPQNAENVGKYLSSVCVDGSGNIGPDKGSCSGSNGYTARIMACFGNNLTYSNDPDIGGSVWDVTRTATATNNDPNPVSDSYLNANCGGICPDTIADCGNTSEEQWEKIVMFVNDASNIKTNDCLAGYTDTSDQSCTETGFTGTASSSGTTAPAPTTPTAGGLTNPFPDGWTPNRLDMGYDGAFKKQIVSPCDGKVIYYVNSQGPHSWEGDYVVVQCSSTIPGLPSNAFYFAEGITATVKQGPVTAGQQIAVPGPTGFSEGPGGIEWGLADPNNPGNALAESGVNGMTACSAASKAMVLSFSQWVQKNMGLPPPSSTNDAGCA